MLSELIGNLKRLFSNTTVFIKSIIFGTLKESTSEETPVNNTSEQTKDLPSAAHVATFPAVFVPKLFWSPLEGKNEDRIRSEKFNDEGALIVVADGVSEGPHPNAGGQAAEIVCNTAYQRLSEEIHREMCADEIIQSHHEMFTQCTAALQEAQCMGATTMLTAMLRRSHPVDGVVRWRWFYSYQGDGHIVLINPKRSINGKILWTKLLPYPGQKAGATAALTAKGTCVPPIIGCVAYEQGDSVYVGSDGMNSVEKAVMKQRNVIIAHLIEEQLTQKGIGALDLDAIFGGFNYSDDAVLGLIATQ